MFHIEEYTNNTHNTYAQEEDRWTFKNGLAAEAEKRCLQGRGCTIAFACGRECEGLCVSLSSRFVR